MLEAPFVYFGGKSMIADVIWDILGQPSHYIEPFFGSGAVLLNRPNYNPTHHTETINDADGFISNVWRSLQHNPDEVAKYCDYPVNHADLSARRLSLIANEKRLLENLITDPEWYDTKMAGYWIWAASCWIGSGLTSVSKIPHLENKGQGVHKVSQRPHLTSKGQGVHKVSQRPHLTSKGQGVQEPYNTTIYTWFRELSERLRYVRVVCGDWTRVCGGSWQDRMGDVGIFFDPPYSSDKRNDNLYHKDCMNVAKDVAMWALERGKNSNYKIIIAGYENEHKILVDSGWKIKKWIAGKGYASVDNDNRFSETLFLSPYCEDNQINLL